MKPALVRIGDRGLGPIGSPVVAWSYAAILVRARTTQPQILNFRGDSEMFDVSPELAKLVTAAAREAGLSYSAQPVMPIRRSDSLTFPVASLIEGQGAFVSAVLPDGTTHDVTADVAVMIRRRLELIRKGDVETPLFGTQIEFNEQYVFAPVETGSAAVSDTTTDLSGLWRPPGSGLAP